MKIVIILLFVFPNFLSFSVREEKWKEIVVMKSTRADVERLLGKSDSDAHITFYTLDEGQISISYSDGQCDKDAKHDWNTPEWTVEEIDVSPSEDIPVADLKVDFSKLEKKRTQPHTPSVISYFDYENGVEYTVQEYIPGNESSHTTGKKKPFVTRMIFFPSKKFDDLLCYQND